MTSMAVGQLPKSLGNRLTTTPLIGKPGPPCLRWTSRNVFLVNLRLEDEKLPKVKARGPDLMYIGVYLNESAQRCSNHERQPCALGD